MITWPDLHEIVSRVPLPSGVRARPMGRGDVPEVLRLLHAWYPELAHSAIERRTCEASFYEEQVALAGEPCTVQERPVYVMLLALGDETVLFRSFEYDADTTIANMRVLTVDPRHRRLGLGRVAEDLTVALLRAVGATLCTCWVTLAHPYAQRGCEGAGYDLIGILPGSDREPGEGGARQAVVEALYAKIIAPERVDWPAPSALRPAVAELMRSMYPRG